jgi:hypothetical protein
MKKINLLLVALLVCNTLFAQISFSDDFESYTVGSPLGPQSPDWTTWSGVQGGADDINVGNTDAHSGTKSLYFSTVAANGGPADIVLPFTGPHNKGTFTFTTWFKMPTGKGGYFNFQGTNTPGGLFTLNTFFNTDGTMDIQNSKEVVLSNTFPQGAWFEFKLVANLNTNSWEAFINNVSKGTFQNADFDVASVDFYATNPNDAFWVDDVSFEHVPYTMPNLNGAVSYFTVNNGLVTQSRIPELKVRNLGTTPITSFTMTINSNGTNLPAQNFTGLTIASGAAYTAVLTSPVTFVAGLNTLTATISNVNGMGADNDITDDQKTFTFTPVVAGEDKMVIAEEATGTWCQWCPRGAVTLDLMHKDFDGFFQGIAVHNNDPMEVPVYDSMLGLYISGYPSALVDRLPKIDPLAIKNDFMQRIILTPVAKLKNGASYNSTSGQLDVSVTTTFKSAASGNYKIACVIIEDSIKGTTQGYAQSNAYAGGSNGVMGGYETKPNPVPAAQMQYDHVAKAIAPNFDGIQNAYPSSVTANSNFIHNFSFNTTGWNKNKLHIVSLFIAPDGKIDNASSTTVDAAVANGYVVGLNEKKITPSFASVYPNPAQNSIQLQINATNQQDATFMVTDLNGKIIMKKQATIQNGVNLFPISIQGLANGNYIVVVDVKGETQTLVFTKE